jgi:signal transduction histidine kinase/ligand-binding sensor domain-containing protein/CheY-like chemotaxis protein
VRLFLLSLESIMRRFLIGPIIASCMAWAIALPAIGQTGNAPPPVRIVPGGEPVFETIDRAHGLQGTTVLEVVSDPHGFIWVAGDAGIQRFDGHSFFNLDRDPDLSDTLESRFIYTLAPSDNSLWIVAPNGLIQRLDESTGHLVSVPLTDHGGDPERFSWIGADAQGRLWRCSDEGLIRLDRNGQVTWVMPKGLNMAFSPDRTKLFAATVDRRVVMIDASEPRKVSTVFNLPARFPGNVSTMTADAAGLWFFADRTLWRLDWESRSLRQTEMPPAFPQAILSVARADDGTLWFGTRDDGLWRYDPHQRALSMFRHNPEDPYSLRPGPVSSLAIDRSNNLWMSFGSLGLGRLRLSQTTGAHYRVKGGNGVCALSEADRRLVVGLCPGGVEEFDRSTGQLLPVPASPALPDRTRAIIGDGKKGLWITSVREGLFHWQPDGSTHRLSLKDPIDPVVTGAYLDDRQRLWISHLRGLAVLEPGEEEVRAVIGYEGTRPHTIGIANDVSPGPNGSLWIGTSRGLISFQPETSQVRRYPHDRNDNRSLSDNDVLQVYTDKGGRLWVATRAGLNRMTTGGKGPPAFKRYGRSDGLPDITVTAIVNDAKGALWIGTNRGVARWNPEEDRFQSYLPADGIPDVGIYPKAAALGSDGRLYFGTSTGLWRFDPQAIRIADPVPVVLSSYEVGDSSTVNLQGKRLPDVKADYSDSVAFRIAVLGDARRLSYRLEGLEDRWRDMPGDLNIAYQHLPPGAYRLQVRQLQSDGEWGAPDLSLPIEIAPPFWRTGWAYLAYALAGIALLAACARAFVAWRHRALREQLKESHARLSVALYAARFGMWAWDVETDEAEFDQYARKLLAVSEGAKPVADIFARMHPDDGPRIRAEVDRALRDDVAVDFEYRLSTGADTAWKWVEGHAVPYRRPGKTAFVLGVNRDATQRKRELLELEQSKQAAEHALEELTRSRLDLSMALESGDLGVWRSALSAGRTRAWIRDETVDCDANVHSIFGWPVDADVDRRRCLRAIHPGDRRHVLARLLPVLSDGGSYADQFRIVRPDGETRCIAVRAVCMRATEAGGASLTGIVHDVTVEEELKASLQRTAEEAQLATEAKGRFLATMSHEIRTPINGVIGMVELLIESPMNQEQQHLLGICRDSAYMLLAIINDILDFSKIEAGKLKLEVAPLSPRRLVESVADALRTQVAQKGIDLDIFVDRDVPRRVLGDRVRLRQVLNNLIGNAIKFTEKGGVRVYVSTEGVAGDRHVMRFDVVDTGIGMDRLTLDNLFQPFQQADEATTRRFGGTGLGLTIVKHLVALMGGQIECDSEFASGSRFSVMIPLQATSAEENHLPFFGVGMTALCESSDRTTLLRELAADIGVTMEVEATFDRVLQRLHAGTGPLPQLLLIDKGFAEDHTALCDALLRESGIPRLPIILVRGDGQPVATATGACITVVAGSPLTAAALARGIQAAMGTSGPLVPVIAQEASAPATQVHAPAGEAAILLAEDNATNREVLIRQLQRLGYRCDVAQDGEQAWALLQAHPRRYRLLLTDCHMPRLDGYELTKRIRHHETVSSDAHLNIVAITANALVGEGERCLALGMDAFLAKPVQIMDLQKMLVRMLPSVGTPLHGRPSLAMLAGLIGNDEVKLQRLLDVFVTSTRSDLDHWKRARLTHDHEQLRKLAHKLKSGCRQLGEEAAALSLEAVEGHVGSANALEGLADRALQELELSLERIAALATRSRREADLET